MTHETEVPVLPPPREFPLRFSKASYSDVFWNAWQEKFWGQEKAFSEVCNRFESVYLDGYHKSRIIKSDRLRNPNIADIERRRWRVVLAIQQLAAKRWAKYNEITGDYACFYAYEPVGSRDDNIQHASFFVYGRYMKDGEPQFYDEGWVRPGEPKHGVTLSEEVQPEVAYEITRMRNRLGRYGTWMAVIGEVLDRALQAELYKIRAAHTYPSGAKDMAQITINDRHYWYRFDRGLWTRWAWPETERNQLEFK